MAPVENAYESIPGWFLHADRVLFDHILGMQQSKGDILEVGVYRGKSAILLGNYIKPGEQLVLCDLFEDVMLHEDIPLEHRQTFPDDLTAEKFLENWDAFHDWRPQISQCDSNQLELIRPIRFAHIDGCHSYQCVASDIDVALRQILPGGVIALDDYRAAACPGVAAAIWEAVAAGRLFPFANTDQKLYACANERSQAAWAVKIRRVGLAWDIYSFPEYDVVRFMEPC